MGDMVLVKFFTKNVALFYKLMSMNEIEVAVGIMYPLSNVKSCCM